MDKELRKALVDHIKKVTMRFAGKPSENLPKLTERQQKIVKALSQDFAGNNAPMIKLISELDGFDYSKYVSDMGVSYFENIPAFCAVVPISRTGGHNYEIDRPLIFAQSYNFRDNGPSSAVRPDGTVGNRISTYKNALRAATMKEIDKLTVSQLEWLADHLILLEKKGA